MNAALTRDDLDAMELWPPFSDPLNKLWNIPRSSSLGRDLWFVMHGSDPTRRWYAIERREDRSVIGTLSLREIERGIDESAAVWEKRDYWMKAEQLRQRWAWASTYAGRLETIIRQDQWDRLPQVLVEIFPHFAEIKVTRLTREADTWNGAYQKLLNEQ